MSRCQEDLSAGEEEEGGADEAGNLDYDELVHLLYYIVCIFPIYIYIYKLPSCIILRSEHVLCSDFNMYYV